MWNIKADKSSWLKKPEALDNIQLGPGLLHLDTYAGRRQYQVEILKETSKRFQIELLNDCPRGKAGDVVYVPKYAVTNDNEAANND